MSIYLSSVIKKKQKVGYIWELNTLLELLILKCCIRTFSKKFQDHTKHIVHKASYIYIRKLILIIKVNNANA